MIRAPMLALLALGLPLIAAAPARADLRLCNRTSYRMQAAVGIEQRANVETRGWFKVDPGECRKVMDGPLDADMTYVHARTPAIYGSAPLPENGEAEFCVRDGDFEFPNGRGCPAAQQARFAAAKPADSDGGPTINLGEQAGYNDAQARLAGLQRLLGIAGYDANPIDGVDGAKTQAALAKFLREHKLTADAVPRPDFFDTLIEAASAMDSGHTPVILVIDRGGTFFGVITLSRLLAAIATAAGQDSPLVRRRLERDVLHRDDKA